MKDGKRKRPDYYTALMAASLTVAVTCTSMLAYTNAKDEPETYGRRKVPTVETSDPSDAVAPTLRIEPVQIEPVAFPEDATKPEQDPETINEIVYAPIWADIPLDAELQHYIADMCAERRIDTAVVLAIIWKESTYTVDAIGDNGRAQGLMQVQARWHGARMEELGCDDMLDPFDNVTVGIDFLDEMIDKGYGVEWALTAYNGGEARAHEYRDAGEISSYAASVLEMAAEIRN